MYLRITIIPMLMTKTELRVDIRCYFKGDFKYFLLSGWRKHLRIGWGISVFGVCSWLWKLLWWLSMYCHSQLGPENHPVNPSVYHHFLSAHCGSLYLQVQWNQGKHNLSKMHLFLQVQNSFMLTLVSELRSSDLKRCSIYQNTA